MAKLGVTHMKLVRGAPAVGRKALQERQERDRIAAPLLRTRFPKVASLKIEFAFSNRSGFLPSPLVTVLHPPARAYFGFACPYGDCDGEFDLEAPVALMMEARLPRATGEMQCAGSRQGGVPCTLCLDYSISAQRG